MTDLLCSSRTGTLRGVVFGNPDRPLVLALHGWLDNAASFSRLAPLLEQYCVVAVDLPGHGQSDWLGEGAEYLIWSAVPALTDLVQTHPLFHNRSFHLLGHSMGSAAALLLNAVVAGRVLSYVALDSLGPLTTVAAQAPQQLAQAVQAVRPEREPRRYASAEDALAARLRNNPELSADCIRQVVERNLRVLESGEVQWNTDPRLRLPSSVRLTDEQLQAFLQRVQVPALVIRAEQGIIPLSLFEQRLAFISQSRLISLPGHHHFHLESSTCAAVAAALKEFWAHV